MSEREIETLCAAYSNHLPADEMPANPGFCRRIAMNFYKWLSERCDITPKSKTNNEAWNQMPEDMRKAITDLYRAYWTTFNTRRRLEEIFGRDNLNGPEEITITPIEE